MGYLLRGVGGDKLWSEEGGGNDLTLTLGETCSGEGGRKSQVPTF